jgi:DNA-binding NarL/FixJ family response regulator
VAEELRKLLEPEFDVVAVVGDANALVREADVAHPDVVVTDIVMPGCDGIVATGALLARHPTTRVVLVTVHDNPELAERGYAAGALGYVLKVSAAHDLVPAVRSALRGERYVSTRGLGASAAPARDSRPGGREGGPDARRCMSGTTREARTVHRRPPGGGRRGACPE